MALSWFKIHLVIDVLIVGFLTLHFMRGNESHIPRVNVVESHYESFDYEKAEEEYWGSQESENFDVEHWEDEEYLNYLEYEMEEEYHEPTVIPTTFKFALAADLDTGSRDPQSLIWRSFLTKGVLTRLDNGNYSIEILDTSILSSNTATNNRSMELSELVKWQDNLLAFCDYTGMVYRVSDTGQVFQRNALADGNGKEPKPFKTEWVTVKDGHLYVGSIGKEWVVNGKHLHNNAEWIKVIDSCGTVENVNWSNEYRILREATDTLLPGYLIHEAVVWNPHNRHWIFLPRRVSQLPYDPVQDERMGSNLMLLVDEEFTRVEVKTIGELDGDWGFSSVKLVPYSNDMVALKVYEVNGVTKTMITVFDEEGKMKLEPEPYLMVSESVKYEGLEFL